MKRCKTLLLESLLKWKEEVTRKPYQHSKTGNVIVGSSRCPVYTIIYLCSIFISHSSNENLFLLSTSHNFCIWLVHTEDTLRPLCDNVGYIAQCLSNGRKMMCLHFSNLLSFLPFSAPHYFLLVQWKCVSQLCIIFMLT